jgi:lysozyme
VLTPFPVLPDGWIAGVDVGRSQGIVNVAALAAAGASFVYVRATDGLHDVDGQEARTVAACDASGIPYGLYSVIEPYGTGEAEAQEAHFASIARLAPGATLPPALDFELGKGRGAIDLFGAAVAWCEACERTLGRAPIVYAGPAFLLQLEALGGPVAMALATRLARWPLWVAHYTGSLSKPPRVPAPWQDWTLWQASGDRGVSLPGGHGWVDLDVYRGTIEELQALGAEPPTVDMSPDRASG